MSTFVVMEAQAGQRKFWAWGRTDEHGGFTDVLYTDTNGDPVDLTDTPKLGRHLFTVPGVDRPATDDVLLTLDMLVQVDEDDIWGLAWSKVSEAAPDVARDPRSRMSIDIGRPRGLPWLRHRIVTVTVVLNPEAP